MAGTNLEAWGLYIPRPLTPGQFTLHSPPRILSPQRLHESSAISDEPPPGVLRRRSFFRHKLASSSSSCFEVLEIISATPLAAMDPESPRQVAAYEAVESSARSSDMESAMPETLGGTWDPCNLDEGIISSLELEGRIAAKEISRWRVDPGAAMPTPSDGEIVMLKSHINRGFSLPPPYFLKGVLRHYRLQLHHIAPNSSTIIAGFVVLCEGYLGIYPRGDLFRLYLISAITGMQMETFATADQSHLFLGAGFVVDARSGGFRSSSWHPAGEGNHRRRPSSSPCLPPE
jgi:hypothetical protein